MGKIKYSDEYILSVGSQYDCPSDFIKYNKKLYETANRRGLLDLVSYKMGYKINYRGSNESILKIASKYDNPVHFFTSDKKLYWVAQRRKLLDKIEYKDGRIGNKLRRMVYVYEFPDKHFYVGITYNEKKRESEHNEYGKTSVSKYKKNTGLIPIKKIVSNGYIPAEESIKLEEKTRLEYIKKGWVSLNKRKCNALGTTEIKWTEDVIREVVSTCKSREEIKDRYGDGLINRAKNLGIYEEITKDIPYLLNYYTKEDAIKITLKYSTKQEFKKENKSLYVIIRKRGWEKDVYRHMISGYGNPIFDTCTGIFYYGCKDASLYSGVSLSASGLQSQLKGRTKNKTNLIIC